MFLSFESAHGLHNGFTIATVILAVSVVVVVVAAAVVVVVVSMMLLDQGLRTLQGRCLTH